MLSILTSDSVPPAGLEVVQEEAVERTEYEFVLGRLQVASVLFVFTVVLVIFSAVSYLAGKGSTPAAPPPVVTVAEPAPAPIVLRDVPAAPAPVRKPSASVFGDPIKGAVYLQMGAVDEGVAALLVEGLRTHGFVAFAAPGPNDKIFRVLIGPLPSADAYNIAREQVDRIGLVTFMRQYEP